VQGVFVIRLEAESPVTRMPRVYQLSVDRDLFGTWVVDIAFGRRGCQGRVMRVLAETEQAVRRLLQQRLRRRTAPFFCAIAPSAAARCPHPPRIRSAPSPAVATAGEGGAQRAALGG
jgi:hypothetical protein